MLPSIVEFINLSGSWFDGIILKKVFVKDIANNYTLINAACVQQKLSLV